MAAAMTTADLPPALRLDPEDAALRRVARTLGITTDCGHDACLGRAVRDLLTAVGAPKAVAPAH